MHKKKKINQWSKQVELNEHHYCLLTNALFIQNTCYILQFKKYIQETKNMLIYESWCYFVFTEARPLRALQSDCCERKQLWVHLVIETESIKKAKRGLSQICIVFILNQKSNASWSSFKTITSHFTLTRYLLYCYCKDPSTPKLPACIPANKKK